MSKKLWKCLLPLCVIVCVLLTLAACGGNEPAETDTDTQAASETETAAPVTDEPTDAPTDAPTEAPTEPETEAETLPPEDLSLPEGYIRLLDAEHQKASKRESKGLSVSMQEENGVSYIAYRNTKDDGYIYVIKDGMICPGRYLKIKYRAAEQVHGQIFLGVTEVKSTTSQDIPYICDGEWHIATLDLWENWGYSGSTILYVRLDPADAKDRHVDVEWMAFYEDDGAPYVNHDTDKLPAVPDDKQGLDGFGRTEDGKTYFRSESEPDAAVFTVVSDYALRLYYRDPAYFNRYTFTYNASEPLLVTVNYLVMAEDGTVSTKADEFYLEAGENATFSSLLPDYFKGEYACGFDGMTLTSVKGTEASFELLGISTDRQRIYASGTYFLENDRYRLGVLLQWGGGISYIEDKQDGDEGLGNLINRADTGRLVQQSYYGVSSSKYHEAMYGGNVWSYNPVQGGDQYGFASRIVDIRLSEDGKSLYIKCRPMDWAQRNMPTKSYMENTYTLTDGGIVVDNRFVDFFYGMKHGKHHQELPAFYTISYLGVFHYYNGSQPWTGGDYETLPNEEFWAGRGSAYHNIVKGNTETWAAWTDAAGYGIGLYVPDIEIMLAGRHAYNGSKDPANGGTNYVAPLRTMEIKCFEPWEYSYVIACGSIDEMRGTFYDYYSSIN